MSRCLEDNVLSGADLEKLEKKYSAIEHQISKDKAIDFIEDLEATHTKVHGSIHLFAARELLVGKEQKEELNFLKLFDVCLEGMRMANTEMDLTASARDELYVKPSKARDFGALISLDELEKEEGALVYFGSSVGFDERFSLKVCRFDFGSDGFDERFPSSSPVGQRNRSCESDSAWHSCVRSERRPGVHDFQLAAEGHLPIFYGVSAFLSCWSHRSFARSSARLRALVSL